MKFVHDACRGTPANFNVHGTMCHAYPRFRFTSKLCVYPAALSLEVALARRKRCAPFSVAVITTSPFLLVRCYYVHSCLVIGTLEAPSQASSLEVRLLFVICFAFPTLTDHFLSLKQFNIPLLFIYLQVMFVTRGEFWIL